MGPDFFATQRSIGKADKARIGRHSILAVPTEEGRHEFSLGQIT